MSESKQGEDAPSSQTEVLKSRADLAEKFIALANLSRESFLDRRRYEWQALAGICIGAGAGMHFVITNREALFSCAPEPWSLKFAILIFGISSVVSALFFCYFWEVPSDNAFRMDLQFKHFYCEQAERALMGKDLIEFKDYCDVRKKNDPTKVLRPDIGVKFRDGWPVPGRYFPGQSILLFVLVAILGVVSYAAWLDAKKPHKEKTATAVVSKP